MHGSWVPSSSSSIFVGAFAQTLTSATSEASPVPFKHAYKKYDNNFLFFISFFAETGP